VRRGRTTISCRAFALVALVMVFAGLPAVARSAKAGDRPPPPKLPLAQWWSVALDGKVSAGPVSNGARIYLAYASGALVALDPADGHELWRQKRDVAQPMAVEGDFLFIASGEAIEALRGATGTTAWSLPHVKIVAPLVAQASWVIATTDTEVIAIHSVTGEIAWRHTAGGVKLAPALDNGRVFTGAEDGRVLALDITNGSALWDQFLPGGITAIAARHDRVYAGSGEKLLYCLLALKKGKTEWVWRLDGLAQGHVAVDDDRVYVAALDNLVRAMDRQNGNQRWVSPLKQRTTFGVYASGHVLFMPAPGASEVQMFWDRSGGRSTNSLVLPGDTPPGLPPAVIDSPDGPIVYAATGGLTNEWSLTKFAPAGEAALIPFDKADGLPGLPYLTDPELKPIGNVLQLMLLGDPLLVPVADADWPLVLHDPPLVPLTTLPGLQLRPLSPVLPVRSGGLAPGG
jgi:outer membrane protein assembly factor BamB